MTIVDRRTFLTTAGSIAAGSTALLAGCSSNQNTDPTTGTPSSTATPTSSATTTSSTTGDSTTTSSTAANVKTAIKTTDAFDNVGIVHLGDKDPYYDTYKGKPTLYIPLFVKMKTAGKTSGGCKYINITATTYAADGTKISQGGSTLKFYVGGDGKTIPAGFSKKAHDIARVTLKLDVSDQQCK